MTVPTGPDVDAALTGGNYEVLRARLAAAGQELAKRSSELNARRKQLFGTTEPQLVATERVRTEHNCAPVDLVAVGPNLLIGFHVFLGLKAETKVSDVLALHRFEPTTSADGDTYDTSALPADANWDTLAGKAGESLEVIYRGILEKLSKRTDIVGTLFLKAENKIGDPAKLQRLVTLIGAETWMGMNVDVKCTIYEGCSSATRAR